MKEKDTARNDRVREREREREGETERWQEVKEVEGSRSTCSTMAPRRSVRVRVRE